MVICNKNSSNPQKSNKNYIFSFEKLEIWVEAKEFLKSIYQSTAKVPETEKFGIISQLDCVSIWIASNIAEGSARKTFKDKAHFTTMTFGSAVEVLNKLIISYELNFVKEADYFPLRTNLDSIRTN